ncbi:hypothetical protein L3Y34_000861 [Caenorhabditis briggsae]|uniref:Uncharacterized protein n=1 Tax=Caenorhabditis briggsae TaxID=6238 RepID=A0AAE9DAP6_CAEBR|nr:hypothetical protein L3Y34_000861 [Caenorhabditis briggsae]
MSVRKEQENLSPKTLSSSPSNCMVVKAGIIPASLSSFPGMEHDRSGFNGLSQETPPNGISQYIEDPLTFDDEREVEAVADASEPHTKPLPVTVPPTNTTPESIPPVKTSNPAPNEVSSNQTLPPLHINVNDCSKADSNNTNSQDPESSSNGSNNEKKTFQHPSIRIPQRPNTSSNPAQVIMGPPSSTNTQVLLSPAGNLQNGFPRKSSSDYSPGFGRSMHKGNKTTHPLAAQRSTSSSVRSPNISVGGQSSRPPSAMASPSGGRKEHELVRRRALVDRITKSRGPDYVHLLPQTEGLSHTQTSILLRKHRGTLANEGMPCAMQNMLECSPESDRSEHLMKEKIKDANLKRSRHVNTDELTDVSDLEDDLEEDLGPDSRERKSVNSAPRWIPKRMRYAGMLARTETLLEEKTALLGMLESQQTVMNSSSGVRFVGEEMIPRRRRQLNGMYFLYDKSTLRRATPHKFGCARAMPIQSWTKRELHEDVFCESTIQKTQNAGSVVKSSMSPNDKWVAIAQHSSIPHLTNGETREITEYDYEEYKAGEGMKRVNELSSLDPMEFILSSDFNTIEDRQMAYMHRLSTAPSNAIRKKHGKSIHFERDYRKTAEQYTTVKKSTDKKKERKSIGEASDDEEQEEVEPKAETKKRSRGRPAASRRRHGRANARDLGIYVDYLFDELHEDICVKQLPNKVAYANIAVPVWYKIPDDYWEDVPSSSSAPDDLFLTNAKQHHKLMHAERQRIIQETTDKKTRNRQNKSAAATPAHNPFNEDLEMDGFPPFDMAAFESNATSSRLYASVEKPYEQRDFLNNHSSQSSK